MKTIAIFLISAALAIPTLAHAKQAWVTDQLKITLRSGESTRHKILRELYAGTELEVLNENPETGFTLVRTAKGHEGYVMSRFVSKDIPPAARVASLEKKIRLLENNGTAKEVSMLSQTVDELNKEISRLTRENEKLSSDLAMITEASGDAIKFNDQHIEVLERNKLLENELSLVKAENARLVGASNTEGYINAMIAVVLGIIIAIVLPRLARPRSSSEWH